MNNKLNIKSGTEYGVAIRILEKEINKQYTIIYFISIFFSFSCFLNLLLIAYLVWNFL